MVKAKEWDHSLRHFHIGHKPNTYVWRTQRHVARVLLEPRWSGPCTGRKDRRSSRAWPWTACVVDCSWCSSTIRRSQVIAWVAVASRVDAQRQAMQSYEGCIRLSSKPLVCGLAPMLAHPSEPTAWRPMEDEYSQLASGCVRARCPRSSVRSVGSVGKVGRPSRA